MCATLLSVLDSAEQRARLLVPLAQRWGHFIDPAGADDDDVTKALYVLLGRVQARRMVEMPPQSKKKAEAAAAKAAKNTTTATATSNKSNRKTA